MSQCVYAMSEHKWVFQRIEKASIHVEGRVEHETRVWLSCDKCGLSRKAVMVE